MINMDFKRSKSFQNHIILTENIYNKFNSKFAKKIIKLGIILIFYNTSLNQSLILSKREAFIDRILKK
jgi:hypothetical protein